MVWEINTFTPSGGDASRFGKVAGRSSGPMLLYCHGVGGNENEFSISDYANLRSWMHDNGWAWAEALATGPGWGNQAQRNCYSATVEYIGNSYDITDIVIFGRSMGGLVASWLYLYSSIVDLCRGLILCSSVQDIMDMYDGTSGTSSFRTSIRNAYGTVDKATTVAAIAGHNPIDFPSEDYTGKAILFQTGTEDDIVNPVENVQKQNTRVSTFLSLNVIDYIAGDHYITRPRWEQHSAFMDSVILPPEPPSDLNVYRTSQRYFYSIDGKYFPVGSSV